MMSLLYANNGVLSIACTKKSRNIILSFYKDWPAIISAGRPFPADAQKGVSAHAVSVIERRPRKLSSVLRLYQHPFLWCQRQPLSFCGFPRPPFGGFGWLPSSSHRVGVRPDAGRIPGGNQLFHRLVDLLNGPRPFGDRAPVLHVDDLILFHVFHPFCPVGLSRLVCLYDSTVKPCCKLAE